MRCDGGDGKYIRICFELGSETIVRFWVIYGGRSTIPNFSLLSKKAKKLSLANSRQSIRVTFSPLELEYVLQW